MPITVKKGDWYIFTGFGSPGRIESVLGQTVVVSFLGGTNPESSREEPIWLIESRVENPEEIARLEAEAEGGNMNDLGVDVVGARYDSQDPLGSLFGALSFGTPHFLEFVNLVRASQEMKNQIKEAFGKLPESSRRSILKMIKSSVHRDELEEVLGHE